MQRCLNREISGANTRSHRKRNAEPTRPCTRAIGRARAHSCSARVATRRRRTREHSQLLSNCDARPRQRSSARVAIAPQRWDRRVDHSKRHAGLAAQMSRLFGGVFGAVHRRRHLNRERIHPSDIAADSMRRRAALPGAETSVPAGLSRTGRFGGANAVPRQRKNRD
jgi:hypothetical protein